MPRVPELDAVAIVSVLNGFGVKYVVIGAFAAIAQMAPIEPTRDIDLTPEDSVDNLTRLSGALTDLDARIRTDTVADGLEFDHDATSLMRADMWNLICRHGEFDLTFHPSGFPGGYRQLAERAHRVVVDDVEILIADLDDVIRSKETAGRPKDIRVLPELYRYRRSRSG
jgi:predicted nucleotidyltransferase